MKKALLGIIGISLVSIALYQWLGNQGDSEDAEGRDRNSRWQSAQRGAQTSSSSHKDKDKNGGAVKNSKKTSQKNDASTISKTGPLSNPFFKDDFNKNRPTWEEAEAFAFREIEFKPQDEQEAALLEMNRYMAATFLAPNSQEKLLKFYRDKGLSPDISGDSNEYTGKMITIRTSTSLPGTRYPHSQYFSNERQQMLMQHTSVEYRPGPQAFERVNKMVKKLYGVKDGTPSKNGRFMNYKLGHGQILWVQKMGPEDLKNSPFNAYEDTDLGTIRMAIEQEIHFEEEGVDPHMAPDAHSEE